MELTDSPIPSFETMGSPSENVLAFARTSASKPDKKKKKKGGRNHDPDIDYDKNIVTVRAGPSMLDETMAHFDASVSGGGDGNQELIDQAISDVKEIFNADNECSRFFEQAVKIATVHSTDGGKSSSENIYARFNAVPAAEFLGKQLQISLLSANKANNTQIGIEMSNPKTGGIIYKESDSLMYEQFDKAIVNIRGPFLSTGKMGSYIGRAGRALMVLHELAHMIRISNGTGSGPLIVPDGSGSDTTQSEKNTEIVEDKCTTELDALRKR